MIPEPAERGTIYQDSRHLRPEVRTTSTCACSASTPGACGRSPRPRTSGWRQSWSSWRLRTTTSCSCRRCGCTQTSRSSGGSSLTPHTSALPTADCALKSGDLSNRFSYLKLFEPELEPRCREDQLLYLQISALDCHGLTILSRHPLLHTITVPLQTRIQDVLDERLVTRAFVGATVAVSKLVQVTLQRYLVIWLRNNVLCLGSEERGAGHSDRSSFDHLVRGGGEQIPALCLHI